MNRRCFFSRLAGAFSAAAIPASSAVSAPTPNAWPTADQPLRYRGYRLHWTGWKASQQHGHLFGQWIAWPERGYGIEHVPDRQPYLYLAVPGFIGGPYSPGCHFNLTTQNVVSLDTGEDRRQRFVAEGLDYIKELVDAHQITRADSCRYAYYQFPRGSEPFDVGVV